MMRNYKLIFPFENIKPFNRILLAIAPTIFCFILRPFLPEIIDRAPIAIFFPLAVIATWLGGSLAGLIAVTISSIYSFYVIQPKFILQVSTDSSNLVRTIVFYCSTLLFLILVSFLQKALKTAQNAVRIREEFLNTISHELRTPLTAMKLNLSVLKSELTDAKVAHVSSLMSLEKQINKQERLINSMMDLMLIETNNLGLRRENCDLCPLVKKAAEAAADSLGYGQLEFDLIEIYGHWDSARIEQAVYNLVHNAVRFGSDGPIKVSILKSESVVEIRVMNKGKIIDQNKKLIFEKFERPQVESLVQGPGIGLYLARHMVELHSGKIDVDTSLEEVTTFTITLPI